MGNDIRPILEGWDFEEEGLQVRIVLGDDGREKLQMRVELGLLQMEMEGRPDGKSFEGFESFLDYLKAKAEASRGASEDFDLSPEDCAKLMREGIQYYHRYLSLFHLGRYNQVIRDTARNLGLFAFVCEHARRFQDRLLFDQYRPYVTMMNTRAQALLLMDQKKPQESLAAVDEGIAAIRAFLKEYRQESQEKECPELVFLLQWRQQLQKEHSPSEREVLQGKLVRAVDLEDYEEAARIRDRLRAITLDSGPSNPGGSA